MELDLQSLFGLHVYLQLFSLSEKPTTPPLQPHLGSDTRSAKIDDISLWLPDAKERYGSGKKVMSFLMVYWAQNMLGYRLSLLPLLSRSRIHEHTISLRFLGIIFGVCNCSILNFLIYEENFYFIFYLCSEHLLIYYETYSRILGNLSPYIRKPFLIYWETFPHTLWNLSSYIGKPPSYIGKPFLIYWKPILIYWKTFPHILENLSIILGNLSSYIRKPFSYIGKPFLIHWETFIIYWETFPHILKNLSHILGNLSSYIGKPFITHLGIFPHTLGNLYHILGNLSNMTAPMYIV